ncbi:hypothetical protein EBS80_00595 [bacterium]|nr:hypothetical protein [bacterium]
MVEFLDVDRESLFGEVVERGREQGVSDQEAYHTLVNEVVEDHRSLGEIHDDSPTDDLVEQLRGRWMDYKEALGLDDVQPHL